MQYISNYETPASLWDYNVYAEAWEKKTKMHSSSPACKKALAYVYYGSVLSQ